MGLFDTLLYGLNMIDTIKDTSNIFKVHSQNWRENNVCSFYFYHHPTHLSLLYAEACNAGGYTCFGVWCRMNGYWNTAYRYLKAGLHSGTLCSRAEFTRVCYVFGQYEEAITAGNRYSTCENWYPTFYMALSYFMLGYTEKCRQLLIAITEAKLKYNNEAALARGFLQSEYGVEFEVREPGFINYMSASENSILSSEIIPVDRFTALKIASATEFTTDYDKNGFRPFSMGGSTLMEPDYPEDGMTYDFLVRADKWVRELPEIIKNQRTCAKENLENSVVSLSGAARDEFIEDCRYLYNLEYNPQTGKFIDAPRLLPSPFRTDQIDELLAIDKQDLS